MAITHRWPLLLALSIGAANAWAIDAPIRSVILYPGSATIERVVQVAPGMTQVEITGLQANFSTETVRLQPDPGIQVGQAVTRDQGRADSANPHEAELEARIQALQDQVAVIDADIKSAQLVQGYLERLGTTGASTERAAPLDPKTMLATLEAIRKGGGEALARIHDDEVKKRALAKQIGALQQDLRKIKTAARASRTITIALAAKQAGKILLSYQVDRAGWTPAYRASLDSNASTVELERMATISQKTGEDWTGVKLRLSTGQPHLSPYAPEPNAWLLDYRPPQPAAEYSIAAPAPAAPPPPPMLARKSARSDNAAAEDDYVAPVLETQGTFVTEFEVPARVDLAADGREISVGLNRQTLKVTQRIRVAPRSIENAAVVTAEAPRPDGVWLSGQVQLQRDGAYVGAAFWNPQSEAQADHFVFPFGPDTLVRVVTEHRDEKSGQTGFFGRDNQKRIADTYVVTSFHKQPVDVLVLEPTPVSQSDKVTVKVGLKPEPTVRDWEHRRGLVGWQRTLRPNETARFDVDYVIDYPKEGYVQGL